MTTVETTTKARTVVRRAVVSDVPQIVMIGKQFHAASGYAARGLHADPFILHKSLEQFIADPEKGVFVADTAGEIIGTAGVAAQSIYFSAASISIEIFWWVAPGRRGGASAIRLLDSLEQWSDDHGCALHCMVDLPGIESPAPKIYARRGYELAERTWIKRNTKWQQ